LAAAAKISAQWTQWKEEWEEAMDDVLDENGERFFDRHFDIIKALKNGTL